MTLAPPLADLAEAHGLTRAQVLAGVGSFDLSTLGEEQFAELARLLTPRLTKYIPWQPTETQTAFLLLDWREALYGGAAGGGKSVALLMAALQYVDVPGYHALLLRRTFAALAKPGALIDLAHEWLSGTDATWNEQRKQWTFPSGATLTFGYLDSENDKYQYQGAAFAFIGFDELTQFTRSQYQYLFSRLRRNVELEKRGVPMRVRAASNPGGEGHAWVFERFFTEAELHARIFIPALLDDNPHLDVAEYRRALAELPEVERQQLENGNWEVVESGGWFETEWFDIIDFRQLPRAGLRRLRFWDTASSKPTKKRKDPDFTVGTLLGEFRGILYVIDVQRFRLGPAETEERIAETARIDGPDVPVHFEQEPGSQSAIALSAMARTSLRGFSVFYQHVTGSKRDRARPLVASAKRGEMKLVRGPWNREWLEEMKAFPNESMHDDQVDSASGAHQKLVRGRASDSGAAEAPVPQHFASMKGM